MLRRQIGTRSPTVEYLCTKEEVVHTLVRGYGCCMGQCLCSFVGWLLGNGDHGFGCCCLCACIVEVNGCERLFAFCLFFFGLWCNVCVQGVCL